VTGRAPAVLALALLAVVAGRAALAGEVRVTYALEGASAAEVETEITAPVEEALAKLPRLARLRSASLAGRSVVTATFGGEADVAAVRDALAGIQRRLPPEVEPPLVQLAPRTLRDAIRYTLESEAVDLATLAEIHEARVKPKLLAAPGVAEVRACGGARREIRVEVDAERLAAVGLELGQVLGAVRGGLVERPGGRRDEGGGGAAPGVVGDLGDLVVAVRDGATVRVRDVATVALARAPRDDLGWRDGREVVEGVVLLRAGAPDDALDRVLRTLGELAAALPENVRLRPIAPRLHFRLTLPAGASLVFARGVTVAIEKAAREAPAITSVLLEIGGPDDDLPRRPPNVADLLAEMKGDPEPAAAAIERAARSVPGVGVRRLDGPGDERRVRLRGPDLDGLERAAAAVLDAIRAAPGVRASGRDDDAWDTRKVVEIDRERAAALGVAVPAVREAVAARGDGIVVARAREGGRDLDVRLTVAGGLEKPTVRGLDGALVPLAAVASLREERAPAVIRREGRARVASVWFEAEAVAAAVAAARERLAAASVPEGVEVLWPAE